MAGDPAERVRHRHEAEASGTYDEAELGADGERVTDAALDELPRGIWTVLPEVPWPGRRNAKVHHVVIGPPGVFVVHSKRWDGKVSVSDFELHVDGVSRHRALAAVEEAADGIAILTPSVSRRLVHPIVCLVRDEPVAGQVGDVIVCSTANIVATLEAWPHEMSTEQLRVAPRQLVAHFGDAPKIHPVRASRPKPARRPRRSRKVRPGQERREHKWMRTRTPGLALPMVATICAAAIFIAAPTQVSNAAESVGDFIAELVR